MAKKEILSRFNLKDYNKELEQILDNKDFQSQVKNLLLSMFYKLETGYKDYVEVKKDSISKESFLESIMYIIRERCDKVELIKPNEQIPDEKRFYVFQNENKIACYQNESSILHAILELGEKNFIIQNKEDLLKIPFREMLKEGYELDVKEAVTNFDGWSWNNNFDKSDRIDYFVIYELLRIIMDNSFMYEWKRDRRNSRDYLKEVEKKSKDFCVATYKYCVISNPENKNFITRELKTTKEKLSKMENKTEFLKEVYAKKKEITEKIKLIDKTINSREMINEEFIIRNSQLPEENKIFSVSDLEEIIQKERETLIKENEAINKMLDPKSYLKKVERLQDEIDLVESCGYKTINNEKIEKNFIQLQTVFLEQFKRILSLTEDRKALQELIYKFRYYIYLPIKIGDNTAEIKDVPELSPELEKIQKKLITKACKQRALTILNQDINYNAQIIKRIINTKQIELSSITVMFTKAKDDLIINIYDGEVLDRTEKIPLDKEKDFRIKFDKKIKIFT